MYPANKHTKSPLWKVNQLFKYEYSEWNFTRFHVVQFSLTFLESAVKHALISALSYQSILLQTPY